MALSRVLRIGIPLGKREPVNRKKEYYSQPLPITNELSLQRRGRPEIILTLRFCMNHRSQCEHIIMIVVNSEIPKEIGLNHTRVYS